MNNREREMIARLESMPLDQARKEITTGAFAAIGSPNHELARSWLYGKESDLRSSHDAEMLAIARTSKKEWYEKPLGMILIGIFASLLAGLLLYVYALP